MLAAMSHRHKTFELWNYSQHEVFNHSSDYGLFKLHPVRQKFSQHFPREGRRFFRYEKLLKI